MTQSRNTVQRKLIFDIVKNRNDHPSADDIYDEARMTDPHISRGTIYRNLKLLSEKGLIRRVHMLDGIDRFDCRTDEHFHFLCKRCGKTIDIDMPPSMDTYADIVLPEGAEVYDRWIILSGLCSDCREKDRIS